jgi:hypothetical protein
MSRLKKRKIAIQKRLPLKIDCDVVFDIAPTPPRTPESVRQRESAAARSSTCFAMAELMTPDAYNSRIASN